MGIRRSLFLALLLASLQAAAARAAWNSSPLTDWLSFGKDKSKSTVKTSNVPGTAATSKTPRVVTKMADGTKRLVSNTTNMLTPKKTTTRKSGTTRVERAQDPRPEKPGFFQSMFRSEPPPPPKTIKEWMSLKQIHP